MSVSAAFVESLYDRLLGRKPGEEEKAQWIEKLERDGLDSVLVAFLDSLERRRKVGFHPAGHFYSPINDVAGIDFEKMVRDRETLTSLDGIDLNLSGQILTWRSMIHQLSTREKSDITPRYRVPNGTYEEGDSLIQKGIILSLNPQRIIEVGSGFSSASMLDCSEEYGLEIDFTFIEPYPQTLLSLLREGEQQRVIKEKVQKVDIGHFEKLERNDILFIDSSHVAKAQSDVNFELFSILPALQSGVVVHFHDVFWPFEYPAAWIKDRGYNWNEIYALRAFLSYNFQFEIVFWNDAFNIVCRDEVETSPDPIRQTVSDRPGGGLWLRKK